MSYENPEGNNYDIPASGDGVDYEKGFQEGGNENKNNKRKTIGKKNRTLQYYKFLFYSIKTEITLRDFIKLINTSNMGEIAIWFLTIILYGNTPKGLPQLKNGDKTEQYSNALIWFHIIHVFRAIFGIIMIYKLPRSVTFVEKINQISDEKLEKTIFNDLIRETFFFDVTEKIRTYKIIIFVYFSLTILNFVFDFIDFLIILANLSDAISNSKVIMLSYILAAVLYLVIDFTYLSWVGHLKYVFPREYLKPLDSIYTGFVTNLMVKLKLRKPKTDIVDEINAQKSNQPYVSSNGMQNGGVNILEGVFGDSLGMYKGSSITNSQRPPDIQNQINYQYNQQGVPYSQDPNSNEQLN